MSSEKQPLTITTWIDMKLALQPEGPRPNYRAMNWGEFMEELAIGLEGLEMGGTL